MQAKSFNPPLAFRHAVFCIFAASLFLMGRPIFAQNDPLPPPVDTFTDTIPIPTPVIPLEERLKDPDFDVRVPAGSRLQPWHDIKSMYPRRTRPINQMA